MGLEMAGKFSFKAETKSGRTQVLLKGQIDEDAQLSDIATKSTGPLTLNMKDITAMNSLGIRTWVTFMKELGVRDVTFEECPPLFVRQMNMVPSCRANAKVKSVYVSYICEECDKEKLALVDVPTYQGNPEAVKESIPCSLCGKGEMFSDTGFDQYFAFCR